MPISVPTLAVADAPPSGALATLTVGDPTATNTLFATPIRGGSALSNPTWTQYGTRVGNGDVSLALTVGSWWVYALSTVGTESVATTPTLVAVTDGLDAVHWRLMLAIEAGIQALALPGLGGRVYKRLNPYWPDPNRAVYPCVFVTPSDPEDIKITATCTKLVAYPVNVLIADRNDGTHDDPLPSYLLWRERIVDAFVGQRSVVLGGLQDVTSRQLPVIDVPPDKHLYLTSGVTLVANVNRPRVVGAAYGGA